MSAQIFLGNFSFLSLFGSMLFYWIGISFSTSFFTSEGRVFGGVENVGPSEGRAFAGASSVCTTKGFAFGGTGETCASLGRYGIILSNFLLGLLLILRWKESGHFPLSNLYESLMFLSWCFTALHLFFFSYQKKSSLEGKPSKVPDYFSEKFIGAITTPSALFINAFATFTLPKEMQEASSLVPALQSNWLMMHVTVMILSYAALILGSLLSIAFLFITSEDLPPQYDKETCSGSNKKLETSSLENKGSSNNGLYTPNASEGRALANTGETFASSLHPEPHLQLYNPPGRCREDAVLDAGGCTTGNKHSSEARQLSLPLMQLNCEAIQSSVHGLNTEIRHVSPPRPSQSPHVDFAAVENQGLGVSGLWKKKNQLALVLDNLSYRILGIGFPFLTIGILSGAVWANEAWGSYWSWDPKETWAFLTWLIYAIYLHTRLNKGWEGKKPAIIASFGFVIVWICYLGVNLIGTGLHSYGWIVQS